MRFLFKDLGIAFLAMTSIQVVQAAASEANTASPEMEIQIKGQFRGRLAVKKVGAPVTLNLEKLQDFPEDPSQKILLMPVTLSESADFNSRSEVKGHAGFWPWLGPVPEAPFLRLMPSRHLKVASWTFEVLNPQGQAIFQQKGAGPWPDELVWDGTDSEKKMAVVDRLYTSHLIWVDKEGKAGNLQGQGVILTHLAFPPSGSQTLEIALSRLFKAEKAEVSPEGMLILHKIVQHLQERSLTRLHVRISQPQADLAAQREAVLAQWLQKQLHVPADQIHHDHSTRPSVRGEIAVLWTKNGVSP